MVELKKTAMVQLTKLVKREMKRGETWKKASKRSHEKKKCSATLQQACDCS